MYFLYLDDSGATVNKDEDYIVLGGVCVPENSVRWLSNEIEQIAQNIDPQDYINIEFHAAEIYRGKQNPWGSLKRNDRIQVIKNLLCVLRNANPDIVLFACAVHKASYPNEDPILLAYEDISSRFDIFLSRLRQLNNKEQQRGMIIIDKTSYETGLQNLAREIRRVGNRWGGHQQRNIIEVPLFVDSKASRITQLADHIAYAVFRRYNAADLNYFNCLEGRFYSADNIIHGLSHKQTYNPNCTCPACITRRKGELNLSAMNISKTPQWKRLPINGRNDLERYLQARLYRFPVTPWLLALLFSIALILYQSHDWLRFAAWFGGGLAIYIDISICKKILFSFVRK